MMHHRAAPDFFSSEFALAAFPFPLTLPCRYQLSGRNITIRGDCVNESGPRPCTLDAVNNNRHFVVSQTMGEAVVFRDLAFVNGSLDQEGTDYSVGGAVCAELLRLGKDQQETDLCSTFAGLRAGPRCVRAMLVPPQQGVSTRRSRCAHQSVLYIIKSYCSALPLPHFTTTKSHSVFVTMCQCTSTAARLSASHSETARFRSAS
jgi:hypothetical protein